MREDYAIHTYRLIVSGEHSEDTRRIEFNAANSDGIMPVLQSIPFANTVQIFEDDRSMGWVTRGEDGYYIISR